MKTFVILSLWVAVSLRAQGCDVFELSLVQENFYESRIDSNALVQWMDAHPPEQRAFAQVFAEHLNVVSRPLFEKALKEGLEKIVTSIPPQDEIILVHPDSGESEMWTSRYAQALIPRLRQAPMMTEYRLANYADTLLKSGKKVHVLALDDAAYSGVQLFSQTANFSRALRRLVLKPENAGKLHVDFFRTIGTHAATEISRRAIAPGEEDVYRWSYGLLRRPIHEIVKEEGKLPYDKFMSYASQLGMKSGGSILTLPFHKIPDHVSLPQGLLWGVVPNTKKSVPFIQGPPERGEPYRQPSYLKKYPAGPG